MYCLQEGAPAYECRKTFHHLYGIFRDMPDWPTQLLRGMFWTSYRKPATSRQHCPRSRPSGGFGDAFRAILPAFDRNQEAKKVPPKLETHQNSKFLNLQTRFLNLEPGFLNLEFWAPAEAPGAIFRPTTPAGNAI